MKPVPSSPNPSHPISIVPDKSFSTAKNQEFQLTPTQRKFVEQVETTNDNFFLNGSPGTGKSVVTRFLNSFEGTKNWTVCAPTGLAARNANGNTLHKTFRLPISDGIVDPSYNNYPTDSRVVGFLRFGITNLIIDEISMVRADVFDYIDRMLRYIKRVDLPFGGIQVVVVGDFCQLPPVVKAGDGKALKEAGWNSPYAFSSKVFASFKVLTLTEVLRQKGDREFIDLLQNARSGKVTPKQMVALNNQVEPEPDDIRIKLYAWNSQADAVNRAELAKIAEPSTTFESVCMGDWPDFPCDPRLELKVGAQVMIKRNGADRSPETEGEYISDVVNGTMGIVKEICGKKNPFPNDSFIMDAKGTKYGDLDQEFHELYCNEVQEWNSNPAKWYVVVETSAGDRKIYWGTWQRTVKVKNEAENKWEEKVVASFSQMPLALAWAITMHKSQGQSFDKVHIDASKASSPGQLYVALSRCRTLEGITLQQRINIDKFKTDPRVNEFYVNLVPVPVTISKKRGTTTICGSGKPARAGKKKGTAKKSPVKKKTKPTKNVIPKKNKAKQNTKR